MRHTWAAGLSALLLASVSVGAIHAIAADAAHPTRNIDKKVDAGNDTGDAQIDKLNQAQLDPSGPPPAGQLQPGAHGTPPPSGAPTAPTVPPGMTTSTTSTSTTTTGAPPPQ